MKKLLLALILLPASSFAENVTFAGTQYYRLSGFGDSLDGYAFGLMTAGEKASFSLTHVRLSEGGLDADITSVDAEYAFGSWRDGSWYAGIGFTDGEGSSEGSLSLGYGKRSGEGLDYDIGLVYMDGETAFGGSLRGEIGDSGWGWQVGAASDGDINSQSAGINYKF
jgi:hypothetical protein